METGMGWAKVYMLGGVRIAMNVSAGRGCSESCERWVICHSKGTVRHCAIQRDQSGEKNVKVAD